MRRDPLLFVGILLLAGALRLVGLSGRGIEYDDAFSIFLARRTLPEIIAGTAADTMPPLYYFLLHFWLAFGQSAWVLRLLNVFLGLGTVGLVYDLARRWFGAITGRWAALLVAVSPLHIFHAQGMRMYVLLGLAQLAYVYFFLDIYWQNEKRQGGSRLSWIGLVACGVIAMYSHNLAIVAMVIPNLYLLLKKRWQLFGWLILAQFIIGCCAYPWLQLVPGQIAKVQGAFWTPRPGWLEIVQAMVVFHTNLPVPSSWLPAAVLVSCLFFSLIIFELLRNRPKSEVFGALVSFTILPPALLFGLSYLMRPVFVPRGFILSSLTYYACAGYAISRTQARMASVFLGIVFILPALGFLPFQYAYAEFPRSPFLAATRKLAQVSQTGDVIIHDNKLSFFPAKYYDPALNQVFLPDPPGSPNDTLALASQKALEIFPVQDLSSAVQGYQRVWFVVFDKAIAEYHQMGVSEHPVMAWLSRRYQAGREYHFNDLSIYEFTR
jgi:mannosyltransferase